MTGVQTCAFDLARVLLTPLNKRILRELGVTKAPAVLMYRSFLAPPVVQVGSWGFKVDVDAVFSANSAPELMPLHASSAASLGCHYAHGDVRPLRNKVRVQLYRAVSVCCFYIAIMITHRLREGYRKQPVSTKTWNTTGSIHACRTDLSHSYPLTVHMHVSTYH